MVFRTPDQSLGWVVPRQHLLQTETEIPLRSLSPRLSLCLCPFQCDMRHMRRCRRRWNEPGHLKCITTVHLSVSPSVQFCHWCLTKEIEFHKLLKKTNVGLRLGDHMPLGHTVVWFERYPGYRLLRRLSLLLLLVLLVLALPTRLIIVSFSCKCSYSFVFCFSIALSPADSSLQIVLVLRKWFIRTVCTKVLRVISLFAQLPKNSEEFPKTQMSLLNKYSNEWIHLLESTICTKNNQYNLVRIR